MGRLTKVDDENKLFSNFMSQYLEDGTGYDPSYYTNDLKDVAYALSIGMHQGR